MMMGQRMRFTLLCLVLWLLAFSAIADQQTRPVLYWGSSGAAVRTLQQRLSQWGYYRGGIDGVFGAQTSEAVRLFQSRNGLPVDGVVGTATWQALGLGSSVNAGDSVPDVPAGTPIASNSNLDLLARVIAAEARNEPYVGQVAVAAVILNRVNAPSFPNSLSGVIFQPHAFESVSNGLVWRRSPTSTEVQAARQALNGWDPTYGSLFFWNPSKPVSRWIWTRQIKLRIGNHVFGV
ncbi:MAG: spore cortex-lytic enzyme [Limnochordia bacterium]